MPAPPGRVRLIGLSDTPRRGPINELPADDLTTGQVLLERPWSTTHVFVGWGWATETHDVTVMDDTGERIDRWELAHAEEGFAKALARLRKHGDPADLPVAIETTRGLAVDLLLVAGHPVVPVHPNAFHAVRARWGASKAKTDAGDSMKLADYLRTDGHMLPRPEPTEQATLDLQALTRILARSWLRVMWACWRDGSCYAPATHQANGKINTTSDTPLAA